ncbi:MAG: class I SAM-dependent methyltransferase [Spirochaetales bacterium]|nr:class I SAM-dependent methyltransferase [Spirochaetales bacterium]
MYSKLDPVVKYYDFSLASCSKDEIGYYKNLTQKENSPCADLGCGTGILSIEIAKQKTRVYSIDNSEFMLSQFSNHSVLIWKGR